MRSPADMQTIQIDITNACNKRCSNCTRFCGNHAENFFMDFDTFKRAVDSLDGYDGVIGVMGGEPTLHPEFERFALYLKEKYGGSVGANRMIYPQREFIKEIRRREFESHILRQGQDGRKNFKMCGPGLWSNMGNTYRKYHELIQDVFPVQFLNDHLNSSYHQPGLFARKDLQIPDEEWARLRDKCWIQNEWSATITPKGAFFCEVAGALDMLFGGPGGWKIEPGWWRRTPEEFGDQLHWCELCGFALETFMRDAEEETDDVSPTVYEMLKRVGSPRMKAGHTNLVKIEGGVIEDACKPTIRHISAALPYIEHYEDRFNEKNSVLFIDSYEIFTLADGKEFGRKLNDILSKAKNWILLCRDTEKVISDNLLHSYVLNPGTLHMGDGFVFFSKRALSLRKIGFDRIAPMESLAELLNQWQRDKIVDLSELDNLLRWSRDSICPGKRYVIWGTGLSGSFLADAVQSSGGLLIFAVDRDSLKTGMDFYGAPICTPEYLKEHPEKYDVLLIGHYSRFEEIQKEALAMGIPEEKIMLPYEV